MNLNCIFASFFYQEKLNLDIKSIEKYCLELKEKDKGRFVTNYGGWQSNDVDHSVAKIQPLAKEILSKEDTLKQILGLKKDVKISLGNYWININNKGHFNVPHVHPFSLFSAVYYVKVPKNSGRLVFENPIQQHDFVMKPDTVDLFNLFNAGYWYASPEENDLIIFPSWLRHWVEPNYTDKNRISIAFNLEIK